MWRKQRDKAIQPLFLQNSDYRGVDRDKLRELTTVNLDQWNTMSEKVAEKASDAELETNPEQFAKLVQVFINTLHTTIEKFFFFFGSYSM